MRTILLTIMILGIQYAIAQTDSAYYYLKNAREAWSKRDTATYYTQIVQAHRLHPYHPSILFELAMAAALHKRESEAIQYLKQTLLINATVPLHKEELRFLSSNPSFIKLKEMQPELSKPIIHSDTAFIIAKKDLHIESITKGPGNSFFLGSIHKRKIISVDEKGVVRDFTSSGQDGLTSVFGLKMSSDKKVLWACSSPMREMENYNASSKSAVHKYDIESKKLLARFEVNDSSEHIFGDLALHPNGDVFVSDSKNNIIYKVDERKNQLTEFFTSKEFWNIQGITFNNEGKSMFIADYIRGIYKLDVKSMRLTKISDPSDVSMKSIDGLTFYKNSLIAIQNYIHPMRVTQYLLDKNQSTINGYKIIDRAHPAFNEPTIGTMSDNNFYYVANSLWSGYDKSGNLKPENELQEVIVLKANLAKLK